MPPGFTKLQDSRYWDSTIIFCLSRSGCEETKHSPAAEHLREDIILRRYSIDIQKHESRSTADSKVCLLSGSLSSLFGDIRKSGISLRRILPWSFERLMLGASDGKTERESWLAASLWETSKNIRMWYSSSMVKFSQRKSLDIYSIWLARLTHD